MIKYVPAAIEATTRYWNCVVFFMAAHHQI